MKEYISIKELSEKWSMSTRRIQILCKSGRIEGAVFISNMWFVPPNIIKPLDLRIKQGKYIKKKK